MNINTHSLRVVNARRTVMELILSDHPAECFNVCKEWKIVSFRLWLRNSESVKYLLKENNPIIREDKSPSIIRDMDKCIMCRRCEMACNEIQTVGCLSAINRGFESVVSPAFEMDLEKSTCTYCGQCVAVCPTGALSEVDNTRKVIGALVDPSKNSNCSNGTGCSCGTRRRVWFRTRNVGNWKKWHRHLEN